MTRFSGTLLEVMQSTIKSSNHPEAHEFITRLVLIGSLATQKANLKDADLLVTVEDETDLAPQ